MRNSTSSNPNAKNAKQRKQEEKKTGSGNCRVLFEVRIYLLGQAGEEAPAGVPEDCSFHFLKLTYRLAGPRLWRLSFRAPDPATTP